MTIPENGWIKAEASGTGSSDGCVEMGIFNGQICMRDSKDPDGPVLRFNRYEIECFFGGVKNDEFNMPAE